jgi:O-acetyl-ADP-ribose deacetylase (regulator of RNase III)
MSPAVASELKTYIKGTGVQVVRGDITELEVDAFVYYAQPDLALGSGFGGAIAVRGGASIQKELDELAANGPLATGEAVISGAGKLNAEHIIHAVGPRFREDGIQEKLFETMKAVLRAAEEKGVKTLAFPAMGAGYYGIPLPICARVMFEALQDHFDGETGIQEVTIALFDAPQFNAFQTAMAALS